MKKELPACPVETTLMLISDHWKVLIIRDLLSGTKRFGELKRSVGSISQIFVQWKRAVCLRARYSLRCLRALNTPLQRPATVLNRYLILWWHGVRPTRQKTHKNIGYCLRTDEYK